MIFFALYENWDLLTIMFIYWCQSVIIGIFTFFKIISLKNFSTEGYIGISSLLIRSPSAVKISLAAFFAFHYGFFHFVYYMFLIAGPFLWAGSTLSFDSVTMVLVIAIFFFNHLFSFLYNQKRDANKKKNIKKIMMFPYFRIIPMHLTIIFGSFFIISGAPQITLILFLILKTIADTAMHIVEHKEELSEKITISLDKTNYKPGEEIRGKLNLVTNRPIKAKSLKISFIVEKLIITPSSDGPKERKYKIHHDEKMLDGEKEYTYESYSFSFHIPQDIMMKIQKWKYSSYYKQGQKIIEDLGLQRFARFQDYNKFYIKAEFDMPLRLNIKNKKEIAIS
jgi:hypothetical protein